MATASSEPDTPQGKPVAASLAYVCGATGASGLTPGALHVVARQAAAGHWPISDDVRRRTVDELSAILCNPDATVTQRIRAATALARLDDVNTRRERTSALAEHHDRQDTTAALRAILATPEGRATLAELSCRLAGEQAASAGQPGGSVLPHVTGQEASGGFDPSSENIGFSNPQGISHCPRPSSENSHFPNHPVRAGDLSTLTSQAAPNASDLVPPGLPNAPASPQGDASLPVDASLSCVTPGEPPPEAVDGDGTTQWASWPPPRDELQRGVRRRKRG